MSTEFPRPREGATRSHLEPLSTFDIKGVQSILEEWSFEHGHHTQLQEVLADVRSSLARQSPSRHFVIKQEDRVLGVVGMRPVGKELQRFHATPDNAREMINLFVTKDYRGHFIGKRLMEKVKRETERERGRWLLVKSPHIYRHTGWGFFDRYFTHAGSIRHGISPAYERVWRLLL